MKIVNLMEDTCGNPACLYEHGFSLYIETSKHKLLADTGASKKTIENARAELRKEGKIITYRKDNEWYWSKNTCEVTKLEY